MESYTGQQQFNGSELVTYNAGQNGGTLQIDNCCIPYSYWYPWYDNHYHYYYPSVSYITEKSKVEQAFKILGKLLAKKIIKTITAKQFIELVNEIASVI